MDILDILNRALGIFDKVFMAVATDNNKSSLFSLEERLKIIAESTKNMERVEVISYCGLTVELARCVGATSIIRGLRAMSDFEYEFGMALMNKKLAPDALIF